MRSNLLSIFALRQNIQREDGSYDAFRVPLLRPAGQHGIYNAQVFREFDADTYMVNFTIRYLGSRGMAVDHLAGCDCTASSLPQFYREDEALFPAQDGEACTETDIRVCTDTCSEWGMRTPAERVCSP